MENNTILTNEQTGHDRIEFIDIAKGIGIFLVVFGHLNTGVQFSRVLIYSFHMPLFFFLSGIFISHKSVLNAFKNIVKSLYLPYFVFILFDFLLLFIIELMHNRLGFSFIIDDLLKPATGLSLPMLNSPIWFLFSLFFIKFIYSLIEQVNKTSLRNAIIAVIVLLCVSFVFFCDRISIDIRNSFTCAVPGFIFFSLGHWLKKYVCSLNTLVSKHIIVFNLSALSALVVLIVLANKNGIVDMYQLLFANQFIYFINSLLGIFVVLIISVDIFIYKNRFSKINDIITFYGQNSLIVLLTHYYVTRKAFPLVFKFLHLSDFLYNLLTEIVLFILTLAIMYPVILIFNKYLYFLIGKNRNTPSKR